MDTRAFKTKTIIQARQNPIRKTDSWYLALDMGYSAVKGMSPNSVFCFPRYAKKIDKNVMEFAKPNDTDILYRDVKTGEIYSVGAKAISAISIESTNDSESTLYGRNTYFSEIFKVCSRVGLALGMQSNEFGSPEGKRLVLQTGLPPKYLESDASIIKEAFTDDYDFEIKIGKNNWMRFTFTLEPQNIHVMSQPSGTLVSVAIDKNGNPTADSEKLYRSRTLIFDPGFKTTDTYLSKGADSSWETLDSVSMLAVLQKTSDEIFEKYKTRIPVPAIQPYLETGQIRYFDKHNLQSCNKDFSDILDAKNTETCLEALDRLCEIYNYFEEIDYLVLTGGTGAAWSNIIRDKLKNLETLTILSGNRNDDLPHIFSNVRGYYMYAMNKGL